MDRVRLAALNNAHLYRCVCGAHGCRTVQTEEWLICLDSPPRFYSQAVALAPGAVVPEGMAGGFKDSFHDISPERYRVLFEAQWIWLEKPTAVESSLRWKRVSTDVELRDWENHWSYGDEEAPDFPRQFPASILQDDNFRFYGIWTEDRMLAGAILNATGPVVGVSNVFAIDLPEPRLWQMIGSLAAKEFPGLPVVGYERGQDLEAALGAGFEAIGPLRVWVPTT